MTSDDREARKRFAKVVAAWADGAEIQSRRAGSGAAWQDQLAPVFIVGVSWRIKPQTIRYRVALMRAGEIRHLVVVHNDYLCDQQEKDSNFIRWITGWQEVEV